MRGPFTLRLLPGQPLSTESLARRLARIHKSRSAAGLAPRFSVSSREHRFVRALQAHARNLWIWRCRQDAFAGDFVVVDMSDPDPRSRRVWVLELKQAADVRSVAGHQMHRVDTVLEELASRATALAPGADWVPLTGDGTALLEQLTGGRVTRM